MTRLAGTSAASLKQADTVNDGQIKLAQPFTSANENIHVHAHSLLSIRLNASARRQLR